MKKILNVLVLIIIALQVNAQEKGSFITAKGGLGPSGFEYTLRDVNSFGEVQRKLGWNASVEYSYFFTPGFGLTAGVGVSYINSIGRFPNDVPDSKDHISRKNYYNLGIQMDDDSFYGPNEYELRARLYNWQENQQTYFIDIPILISLKHKFGSKKVFGVFLNAGAAIKIPIIKKDFFVIDSEYSTDGILNISGFYEEHNLEIGVLPDPQSPEHGFGTIHNPNEKLGWNGKLLIKPSIALIGEAGFLIGVSRRVDIMLGAFADYGLNNIKKAEDTPLLTAPENYHPNANHNVGNGITYAGMINSDVTDKVSTFSYGGKIGVTIKLGKLSELEEEKRDTITDGKYDDIYKALMQVNAQLDSLLNAQQTGVSTGSLLEGVVLDAKDKLPLSAVLEIYNIENELIAATVSDPNTGKFSIGLTSGDYTINTTKEGYIFKTEPASIPVSETPSIINKIIYLERVEVDKTVVLNNIQFDFDKATLKQRSYVEIAKVAKFMNDNPTVELELAGHTDNAGPSYYNRRLSQRRAEAVVKQLVKSGIDPARLKAVGYGKDKPIATNATSRGRALNRRTEFKILKF